MAGEWTETTLGRVTDFLSGGTPSKERAEYWDGSIPWVSAKDMKRFRLDDTEDHVTEEGLANGTKLIPSGTVLLLARGMTLLKDLPICVANRPMTFNQDVKALRPRAHVRDDFLPYLLLGHKERLLSLVDLAGHGTGRLNSDELKALDVSLPPEAEQRAIAHVLGTLDDKIDLNRRMSETLEAMARALFQSWFVDFDPVRAKDEGRDFGLPKSLVDLFPDHLENSELGEIPSGWSTIPLSETARYINGAAYAAFQPNQERRGLPIIKIAELKAGVTSQTKFSDVQMPEEYRITRGDILFSWSGNPDTSIDTFVWSHDPGWLNQHIFRVVPHHQGERAFVLSTLKHLRPVFAEIARNKQTTGLGHVTAADMKRLLLAWPDDRTMRAWSSMVATLQARALHNEIEIHSLTALRDALLPRLLSGEIRVGEGVTA